MDPPDIEIEAGGEPNQQNDLPIDGQDGQMEAEQGDNNSQVVDEEFFHGFEPVANSGFYLIIAV